MAPSSVVRKLPHQASRRLTRTAFSGTDVSTHRTIALFDPPADGALTGIVGAIKRFPFGSFPRAVARQAVPEIPPIQKQESETIGQTLVFSLLRRHGLQIAPLQRFQFRRLLPLPTLDQCALFALSRLPPAASTRSTGFEGPIRIFGHQGLVAFNQGLSIAQHMRFTDLVLHAHLISHRFEAISIIGDQYLSSYARGDRQSLVLKRLDILRCQRING